jgi:hypothetical protein
MTTAAFPSRLAVAFAVCALSATTGGCSGRSELAAVTGTVTLDGQPLPSAFIVFAPTGSGTSSRGKTDAAGRYEMMFSDREKGAWIGENMVRISTGDVGSGDQAGPKEIVPAVYNRDTTLKVVVQPGSNTFDFQLDSKAGRVIAAPVE